MDGTPEQLLRTVSLFHFGVLMPQIPVTVAKQFDKLLRAYPYPSTDLAPCFHVAPDAKAAFAQHSTEQCLSHRRFAAHHTPACIGCVEVGGTSPVVWPNIAAIRDEVSQQIHFFVVACCCILDCFTVSKS